MDVRDVDVTHMLPKHNIDLAAILCDIIDDLVAQHGS